ncbi:hypothetical protein [Streptomyces azureus]|uniref:Atrophin-1 domain-containing protein n=1 Tax=Streptomyces azureus TaxID=146537 RepID=A0A0K8PL47_STRAJ|nr:atrophin-1 domain-containing protein [Streptomyces azureus]
MSADARDQLPETPARARTGPRHAAPKKPLFTRFQMPAGKAIAMAAMPTAVLMGMGFTPTLALADDQPSTSNSLKADEYKDCVAALEGDKDKDKDGASPSPSASGGEDDGKKDENTSEPTPSAPAGGSDADKDPADSSGSSDSGSDDTGGKTEPTPTPSPSSGASGEDDAATPSPSPSKSAGNVLEDIGDAIGGIFNGGKSTESPSPSPTPSASASPSGDTDETQDKSENDASDTVKETTDKVTDTAKDTVKDTTDTASKAAEDTTEAAEKAAEEAADKATASPSPSASPSVDPEDCPAATDAEGGVDNQILVPDDPWYLEASSLTLKGADYQGIVQVKTASGATKKVLKYVINDGTDIGDLHQLVKDKQSGKTHHVQAAKGSMSTITDGKTVMYTEKISGNLLGLIPVTFDPEHPPPLNIPLIYFTKVKVTQAGQFGGTLTVPGLRQYVTD